MPPKRFRKCCSCCNRAGVEVTTVQEYRPTFDEVFIQLMGDTGDLNDYD